MEHPEGQKRLEDCGRSGVYFRILEPGKIRPEDFVERIEQAKIPFMISDVFATALKKIAPWAEQRERAIANGSFPKRILEKWKAI
jgi:MOSC domain-containing protein YiiM